LRFARRETTDVNDVIFVMSQKQETKVVVPMKSDYRTSSTSDGQIPCRTARENDLRKFPLASRPPSSMILLGILRSTKVVPGVSVDAFVGMRVSMTPTGDCIAVLNDDTDVDIVNAFRINYNCPTE
jgi:hypothetical protein